MCLGIPMEVLEVDGLVARCEAWGAERQVDLLFLADDEVKAGEFVLVHLGRAQRKMTGEEARLAQQLLEAMASP